MGFFKLGKIEKTPSDAAKHEKALDGKSAAAGGASAGSGLPGKSAGSQEKAERKKKSKGETDPQMHAPGDMGAATAAPASSSKATSGPSVNDFITKTKTQFISKGLKPSGPELIAYARYLGIDPVADHDLLWIATEALEAPLPSEWTEHFDSNDRVFYYNATTKVSSWTHPLEHEYRDTYDTIVNFRNSNVSPADRAEHLHRLQVECEQMERDVHKEVGLWTEHTDEHGHRFYYNAQARQSTWTDPRPAKCHILYLRMKMIRVLESSMRSTGAAAHQAAAHAEAKDGHSRFAPLSKDSPRRESDGKRPKVSEGERGGFTDNGGGAGQLLSDHWAGGGNLGAERGGGVEHASGGLGGDHGFSPVEGGDHELLGADSDYEEEKKHKKKKKKKHKDHEKHLTSPGGLESAASMGAKTLQASQSEPTVGGGKVNAPPPMADDRGTGVGGGLQLREGPGSLFPDRGGFGAASETESLSNVGRARIKAGIRLQPIGANGLLGPPPAAMSSAPPDNAKAMQNSVSVPELKPLDKLHPLM
eukprot:TRINITY_DN4034_c0_g1_i1.p1 TRINITY_DN4034_c0_g1~~TRINITY_DN4034_c0_g1_i1.p1  ORF type:complete len:532 (-),score=137.19 TRINITY_DN4034_c0_g1_i1:15-1610(-)